MYGGLAQGPVRYSEGRTLFHATDAALQPVVAVSDASGVEVIARDGFIPQVSTDGMVAFSREQRGGDADPGGVPNVAIVVLDPASGTEEIWSASDDGYFEALGWAGERLIAWHHPPSTSDYMGWHVGVFDGPGRFRDLSGFPLAVSPDGATLAVYTGRSTGLYRLIDIATGSVAASLDLEDYALAFFTDTQREGMEFDRMPAVEEGYAPLPVVADGGLGIWHGATLVLSGSRPLIFSTGSVNGLPTLIAEGLLDVDLSTSDTVVASTGRMWFESEQQLVMEVVYQDLVAAQPAPPPATVSAESQLEALIEANAAREAASYSSEFHRCDVITLVCNRASDIERLAPEAVDALVVFAPSH